MIKKYFLTIAATLALASCSSTDVASALPDNRPDYKQSRVTNPLEIPPDLTQSSIDDALAIPELSSSGNADLSTYQGERNNSLSSKNNLEASLKRIHRSGDAAWIEIDGRPTTVFQNAKNFWTRNGLPLTRVDKNIGIMETDWLEADSNLPNTGISRLISTFIKPLSDSGVRDKFRTRVDFDGKKTLVYVTHYGATEKELNTGYGVKKAGKKAMKDFAWVASSRNPELEVEMLRRLNLYLNQRGQKNSSGGDTKTASAMQFTSLKDGTPALVINSDFNQAWVLLGIAIDRAGYEIDSQVRKDGTYSFAKITDKKVGFIVKEVERTIDNYTIGLADQGNQQIAVVRTHNRKPVSPDRAKAILQKISQEIRF